MWNSLTILVDITTLRVIGIYRNNELNLSSLLSMLVLVMERSWCEAVARKVVQGIRGDNVEILARKSLGPFSFFVISSFFYLSPRTHPTFPPRNSHCKLYHSWGIFPSEFRTGFSQRFFYLIGRMWKIIACRILRLDQNIQTHSSASRGQLVASIDDACSKIESYLGIFSGSFFFNMITKNRYFTLT